MEEQRYAVTTMVEKDVMRFLISTEELVYTPLMNPPIVYPLQWLVARPNCYPQIHDHRDQRG